MELMELYDQIHNPIDDQNVIKKLIDAYAKQGYSGYYGQLTKIFYKEIPDQYVVNDRDEFYSMLFNKWKNNILAMTKKQFDNQKKYDDDCYGADFIKMRDYLKNISDVSTAKEAKEILHGDKGDIELEEALEKYDWQDFGFGTGWVHVCSRYLTAHKDQYPNVEHRLYLDTEGDATFKMATYLVKKFDEHHLPYYFKFAERATRNDTMVIYSSTENLTKYIEILQEIKKEHPQLVSRIKEPPILTGIIDGWIGYGSEPAKTPDGNHHSFNEIRSNLIKKSIDKVIHQWIMNHRQEPVIYQNQQLNFQDFISMLSAEKVITELKESYSSYEKKYQKKAENKGIAYNKATVNDRLGYTLEEVENPQFKQNLYTILKNKMPDLLTKFCSGNPEDIDPISININNDKQVEFNRYKLETIIQQTAAVISKIDSNFINTIQAEIKNNTKQYGIDNNKFCFDIKAKEKMETITKQQTAKTEMTKNDDMHSLDAQGVLNNINPSLIEKKLKLTGDIKIPAKQYLYEIVFPQLPENGIVILKNGITLPVKQFIEEGIFGECQEKYNGDFEKYMAEKTRNNLGVISINNGDKKYEINSTEITELINPDLLEKRIKLSNGVEIPAKQYIQEIYSPHIPANGQVILKNDEKTIIPVQQYIEDILLIDQQKYNGEISQTLYKTTRNNTGSINEDPKDLQETLVEMKNQINIEPQKLQDNLVELKKQNNTLKNKQR